MSKVIVYRIDNKKKQKMYYETSDFDGNVYSPDIKDAKIIDTNDTLYNILKMNDEHIFEEVEEDE
jgi:hypothetical protein